MSTDLPIELSAALARLAVAPNDEVAWRSLYFRTWPLVYSIVVRVLCPQDLGEAEDAAQDVFHRLVQYGPFERLGDPAAFIPYVSSIARNVALSRRRQKQKRGAQQAVWSQDALESVQDKNVAPDEAAILSELMEHVLTKLDSDVDRKLLSLLLQGQDLSDCARQTGLSYRATAVRLHRIRRKLRNVLKELERDE